MFISSTQMKNWTFSGTTELNRLRVETNENYVKDHMKKDGKSKDTYLTAGEERLIYRHYEYLLKEFCGKFKPPMPHSVVGVAMAYFKRFYLHTSVMDYLPKHIVYTCVYLACKVDEFNVSIMQFVENLPSTMDREHAADMILLHELLLMKKLNYNLTIHLPYRPLEGLLIDIKTRSTISDPDKLRPGAEEFLDICLNTDVGFVFAPSQIALASVLSSAAKQSINLDSYAANVLLATGSKENLMKAREQLKRIRFMVKQVEPLNREEVKNLERKLETCKNEENDPDSDVFQQKLEERQEEEEVKQVSKRRKIAEEEAKSRQALLWDP